MALEVSIPKEITEYQEKIFWGLNMRQLITVGAALVVGVPTSFLIYKLTDDIELALTIVMFLVAPIFAFGFIKLRGYPMEEYIKIVYQHRVLPQKRTYTNRNLILAFYDTNDEKKQSNSMFYKGRKTSGTEEACLTALKLSKPLKKAIQKEIKLEIKRAKSEKRDARKIAKRDAVA